MQDMWARMLEDNVWLDKFLTDNQRRLAGRYAQLTAALEKNDIPYFKRGNAGLFLMVDLRKYFQKQSDSNSREEEITEKCLKKGLMVAKGSNFVAEEVGWFRVTFTPADGAFEVGVQRLLNVLSELNR